MPASMIYWSEFPATDLEAPGSILGTNHIFWEIVDLEQGPLSLVRITEEVLGWKRSGFCLETLD
jgi:hypothetical protein